jgi:uncharacterized YigZ family protein
MSDSCIVPAGRKRIEFYVLNSRFIATVSPAFSTEEAKAFIENIRSEFEDATHNVPAFIIGHPPSVIEHSSDDGEPNGTAGRPILSILRGSEFGDIVIVVTRYFGGTKLGTGGLVRAYGDAARKVLAILPKAQKISTVTAQFKFPYRYYDKIEHLLEIQNTKVISKEFGVDVHMTVQIADENFSSINGLLINTTNGEIITEIVYRNDATIMPF